MSARSLRAGHLRKFHGIATLVWAALVVPTILWWRESVPWLVFMSIYTVIVDHAGAWQAARAETAASNNGDSGSPP